MKAAYLNRQAGADALELGEVAKPHPKSGEVLVKVHATTVTPTELEWFPTFKTPQGNPRPFPIILSHEFAGLIEAVGPEVSDVKIGERVYGINDWFSSGAQAEYCLAPANAVAPKPDSLDFAQAAVVPISALTAWQGLFDRGRLAKGERVLVHGGSGGVGVFAVQLARWRGAHVIATTSRGNVDFVRSLGADEVIDYQSVRFEQVVSKVNLVFDTVGGETLARSWDVLGPNGRLVTIAVQAESATEQRVRAAFFIVEVKREQLIEITALFDQTKLRAFVEAVYPLSQVREAYARARAGKMRGKVAIQIG
jgi:NADPH:quinone reductase-like Zn-dependent oxidoreductase